MKDNEYVLLKGNEAIAHAAIRCGCDGFFGYPITPQSEILETLSLLKPWETTGMVVLQAESEVAAINMLYGGGGSGKRVMTTSSSPGVALMQEGMSYMAVCEIPALIVNVQRGGPGLGTIQPSQSDYLQATVGGGNGDYQTIVLAPASVQEMADFVDLAFQLGTEKQYRIEPDAPVTFVLGDGTEITLPQTRDEVNFIYLYPTLSQLRSLAYGSIKTLRIQTEDGTLTDAILDNSFSKALNQQYQLLMSLSAR